MNVILQLKTFYIVVYIARMVLFFMRNIEGKSVFVTNASIMSVLASDWKVVLKERSSLEGKVHFSDFPNVTVLLHIACTLVYLLLWGSLSPNFHWGKGIFSCKWSGKKSIWSGLTRLSVYVTEEFGIPRNETKGKQGVIIFSVRCDSDYCNKLQITILSISTNLVTLYQ